LVTVQTAEWFGSYFVSFLVLAVNACVAYALLYADLKRIASVTACGIFLLNLLSGTFLLYADRDEGESVTVAAVQGNIENKWDFGILKEIETVYREYTLVAAKNGAEIVVWPETALPVDLLTTPSLMKYAQDLAKEANVTLIIGSFHAKETEDGEYLDHNSLFMISPDGTLSETVYDKQHLVPFGEYVPMRSLIEFVFPPLADVGMLEGDLGRGAPGVNFSTEYGEIGCMICFDSIYEDVAISAVRNGAEILCLASNDAWFLDSAAIYMHHDQARLRAIETSRYLVRAGNSGITSVISPSGKVLSEIEPMTEGYVLSKVTVRTDRTLYSYIGNAFVYLLLAGIGVLLCVSAFDAIAARRQTASEKKEC
ncbi:MAG: apolipoprotein N-acyltransferase, partial [Clostridia bacterium]|nr:apolipoprotein N-acyltransferase [Clostridia bacterium]